MIPDLLKWNLLVGKQLVPGRNSNYQGVSPDGFGNNIILDISCMCKSNSEIARPQSAYLFSQWNLRKPYFNLWLFLSAVREERRQALVYGAV
ncbi:hypothetical protein KNHN1_34470 [Pseudomonas guariconensis]|nr:hypothetical protein D407_0215545 [Pseudomonas aeruginosa]KJC24301.1 hypothetical protein TN45_10385 [Pseudomonas aeruginosa]OQD22951.1 hypothetical protein UE98_17445 [Burkholderia cenocepacia]OXZ07723.1 hypothetical protein ACG87_02665 [Pseudomonas aeruginosa]BDC88249.1 hypothetical protein NUITMVA2_36060 [Aeromonas caviae]